MPIALVLAIGAFVAMAGITGLTTLAVTLIRKGEEGMALYPTWLIFIVVFFFLMGLPLGA